MVDGGCSKSDWRYFKDFIYCTVHKTKFSSHNGCPLINKKFSETAKNSQKQQKIPENSQFFQKTDQDSCSSPSGQAQDSQKPVCDVSSQHAKKQASESLNTPLLLAGIDNSTPVWVDEVNKATEDIRSHAFTFKVTVQNPKNWSIRQKILESAGFKVLPKGGVAHTDMIFFNGFKIWLSKYKITVYFPDVKQYWVDMARTGYNYAIADLVALLNDLEKVLGSDFRINNEYHFRVSRQHHALVQNSLAKQYNRQHKKLEVFNDKGELWLLIDNSDPHNIRMNDLETVHRKESPKDMDSVVKPFFEQLHTTGLMPNDILNALDRVARIQEAQVLESRNVRVDVDKRLVWMDTNFQSHQRVLEKIESRLDALKDKTSKRRRKPTMPRSRSVQARRLLRKFGW
jgi:hypothetical protein